MMVLTVTKKGSKVKGRRARRTGSVEREEGYGGVAVEFSFEGRFGSS